MRTRLWATGLALLLATACSGESVRRATYPPQFRYISKPSIANTMWKLAERAVLIDTRLHEGNPTDEAGRAEIVRLLTEMDEASAELSAGGRTTNHPLIDANLDRFRADLKQARVAAERSPPEYFLAGSVAGSCMYCHGSNEEKQ